MYCENILLFTSSTLTLRGLSFRQQMKIVIIKNNFCSPWHHVDNFVHGFDEKKKNLWRFSLQNRVISKWEYILQGGKLFQEQFL